MNALDGVVRAAEAFAAPGDREAAAQWPRVAEARRARVLAARDAVR